MVRLSACVLCRSSAAVRRRLCGPDRPRLPAPAGLHQLAAEVRRHRDGLRGAADGQRPLVWLVKADVQTMPLTVHQARNVLRLDAYRNILHLSGDVDLLHLWAFPNSSAKTADLESDVWATLCSLGVQRPHHVCDSKQLDIIEQRLLKEGSMVVDFAATEASAGSPLSGSVKDFLQTHPAEMLRLSTLLESDVVEQPEGAVRFYRTFVSFVDDYVTRNLSSESDIGSAECDLHISQTLQDQETEYYRHLYNFETRKALDVLWETMTLLRSSVESGAAGGTSALALLAAKHRLLGHLARLGVTLDDAPAQPASDGRMSAIVDAAAAFRHEVRRFALEDKDKRAELMGACDGLRNALLEMGVKLQDKKNQALWLWTTPKRNK
ncbi:uncharacterized protein LOC119108867 isoform X2 [Pollicipes pollicipes]|uniref:uncharacterized protein LOC119108867 isoform X2 n=1 Tax=Pollicipes pollicipes TaxID=41117 RepID=UPI001884CD18|nr:uncharacterized protein LOC119108867 isoform X2 [Pollicipes pollicipes]